MNAEIAPVADDTTQSATGRNTPLTFLGAGSEGRFLFTDGVDLYLVWERTSNNDRLGHPEQFRWFGMKVDDPSDAFPTMAVNLCGAEVDMRQNDEDPFTDEVMELGDRMAAALNKHFNGTEKRLCQEWDARKKEATK